MARRATRNANLATSEEASHQISPLHRPPTEVPRENKESESSENQDLMTAHHVVLRQHIADFSARVNDTLEKMFQTHKKELGDHFDKQVSQLMKAIEGQKLHTTRM